MVDINSLFSRPNEILGTWDLSFIGKDGKRYDDYQALRDADRAYISEVMSYIGSDGKAYGNAQDLYAANRAYGESLRRTARVESF